MYNNLCFDLIIMLYLMSHIVRFLLVDSGRRRLKAAKQPPAGGQALSIFGSSG